MKKSFTYICCFCWILGQTQTIYASGNYRTTDTNAKFDVLKDDHNSDHDHHEHEEAETLKKRLQEMADADIYSCRLNRTYNQCRQYPIPENLEHKLSDLKERCLSMPNADFTAKPCPTESRIAQCQHIQLDYHDPQTLIYDNHYYAGKESPWTPSKIKRVCMDLEGDLVGN